jgi:hypothetical protein
MPLAVVLRESGGPITPRPFDSTAGVFGILGRPVKPGDDGWGERADVNETSLDTGQRVHHFPRGASLCVALEGLVS